jgi:shikimate dehydrogenase
MEEVMNKLDGITLGLLGYPLGHSFSKTYFEQKFKSLGIEGTYLLIERPSLIGIKQDFHEMNLNGFNITIPHKQSIIEYLDQLSEEAHAIGAVNCVSIRNNNWTGHNTDIVGFDQSFRPWLIEMGRWPIQKVLILGTGGSSAMVQYWCHKYDLAFDVVSRNKSSNYISYQDIEYCLPVYDLVVNCTPSGMYPNTQDMPAFPFQMLNSKIGLIDLVYNPLETNFLKSGKLQGCPIKNGLEMLHLQAEAAWKIWIMEV